VAAYVRNYLVTFLFVALDDVDLGEEGWKIVGNILYNAQFVNSEITTSASSDSLTVNFVTKQSSSDLFDLALSETVLGETIPTFAYHLAPIVVLVIAGLFAARQLRGLDVASGAAAGAAILPGTLVSSALGVFLFETSGNILGESVTLAPELLTGILLVGVVVPAVAGAVGGAIDGS